MNQNEALKEDSTPDAEEARLEQILALVRDDVKRDPAAYLKDSIVPEGGE